MESWLLYCATACALFEDNASSVMATACAHCHDFADKTLHHRVIIDIESIESTCTRSYLPHTCTAQILLQKVHA